MHLYSSFVEYVPASGTLMVKESTIMLALRSDNLQFSAVRCGEIYAIEMRCPLVQNPDIFIILSRNEAYPILRQCQGLDM